MRSINRTSETGEGSTYARMQYFPITHIERRAAAITPCNEGIETEIRDLARIG